ncbi:DMT family transporter [Sneathiella glossodoripedis]|uniref:DMT family transporter n=1 Tax=Sneathiella glossodoripedis TaxID=418853 RepID=UPI0004725FBD|nr:DMT family transporter [Sneathiella glossodoripedis]
MPTQKTLGYIAIMVVVCMWSGWIVTSRSGATSPLTIYDIAVLRYGVSALITFPFLLRYKPWKTLSLPRLLITSQLAGIPYILAVFLAFELAPAAHGGIFMNGALPAITLLLGWVCFKEHPNRVQYGGAALIITGAALTLFGSSGSGEGENLMWLGDLLFLFSGLLFALYMVFSKLWLLTPSQILFCSSVVNAVILVPVWYFFLPTGVHEATLSEILLQGVYQGVLATLVGLLLVAFAVRHIGAPTAAAFMSGVPSIAAILGYLILGEEVNLWVWISLLLLTPGIILTAVFSQEKYKRPIITALKQS